MSKSDFLKIALFTGKKIQENSEMCGQDPEKKGILIVLGVKNGPKSMEVNLALCIKSLRLNNIYFNPVRSCSHFTRMKNYNAHLRQHSIKD